MDALRRSLKGGGSGRDKAERFMASHAKKTRRAPSRKRSTGRKRAA
jgi:hypothetical protein